MYEPTVIDYSGRRGAIVPLLPKIYELYKARGLTQDHYVHWSQAVRKELVDIRTKWVIAQQGTDLKGLLQYRVDADTLYVEVLLLQPGVDVMPVLKKFERDGVVRSCGTFYFSRNLKKTTNNEILDSVGLLSEPEYHENGYRRIGDLNSALTELQLRYA